MQPVSLPAIMAVYLALCGGCLKDALAGSVLLNSIKNLPGGGGGSNPSNTVSASPHVSTSHGGAAQKGDIGTSPPASCAADSACATDEFCNDVRGACLPCRKRRKRCVRDAMCCPGNRCSNGVCQPIEMGAIQSVGMADGTQQVGKADALPLSVTHKQNLTVEPRPKRPVAPGRPQPPLKGREGDTCLRSSDCSAGLCCARHFWSRICKPVLTEGQMCTRHRRKAAHGLEIFQRCDCGEGLACRAQRGGEPQTQPSGRPARNLHTCQTR